jgi:pentapeptide MXKDX repeat protein
MNLVTSSLALAGLLVGGGVFADDTMSHATMTPRQAMKDCIERQKTADVNMSKAEMKRICKDKLKNQKATGDMPEQPPTDSPHN